MTATDDKLIEDIMAEAERDHPDLVDRMKFYESKSFDYQSDRPEVADLLAKLARDIDWYLNSAE